MQQEEILRRQMNILMKAITDGKRAREEALPHIGTMRLENGSAMIDGAKVLERWDDILLLETDALEGAEQQLAELVGHRLSEIAGSTPL